MQGTGWYHEPLRPINWLWCVLTNNSLRNVHSTTWFLTKWTPRWNSLPVQLVISPTATISGLMFYSFDPSSWYLCQKFFLGIKITEAGKFVTESHNAVTNLIMLGQISQYCDRSHNTVTNLIILWQIPKYCDTSDNAVTNWSPSTSHPCIITYYKLNWIVIILQTILELWGAFKCCCERMCSVTHVPSTPWRGSLQVWASDEAATELPGIVSTPWRWVSL